MTARLIRERAVVETFADAEALCERLMQLLAGDPARFARTEISYAGRPTEPAVRVVAMDGARERWIGCAVIQPDGQDWPPPMPPAGAAARHRADPALAAIAGRMGEMGQRVAA